MNAQQLAELAGSLRQAAIDDITAAANHYNLPYVIEEDTISINLPNYDDVVSPVVATIHVPEEDTNAQ